MISEYKTGQILIDSDGQPFIHDGTKNADGYGCLIGFSDGILCRSSGINNFHKTINKEMPFAPMQSIEWLMSEIRHANNIPFYSCI